AGPHRTRGRRRPALLLALAAGVASTARPAARRLHVHRGRGLLRARAPRPGGGARDPGRRGASLADAPLPGGDGERARRSALSGARPAAPGREAAPGHGEAGARRAAGRGPPAAWASVPVRARRRGGPRPHTPRPAAPLGLSGQGISYTFTFSPTPRSIASYGRGFR